MKFKYLLSLFLFISLVASIQGVILKNYAKYADSTTSNGICTNYLYLVFENAEVIEAGGVHLRIGDNEPDFIIKKITTSVDSSIQTFTLSFMVLDYFLNTNSALGPFSLEVIDQDQQSSFFPLTHYYPECTLPTPFQILSFYPVKYDFSSQMIKIEFAVVNDIHMEKPNSICSSTWGPCQVENLKTFLYVIKIQPKLSIFSNPSIDVELSAGVNELPFSFNSPFNFNNLQGMYQSLALISPNPGSFSETFYPSIKGVYVKYIAKKTEPFILYTYNLINDTAYSFAPLLSDGLSTTMITLATMREPNLGNNQIQLSVVGKDSANLPSVQTVQTLLFGYQGFNLISFTGTTAFNRVQSVLGLFQLSLDATNTHNEPKWTNFMGDVVQMPYPYGFTKTSSAQIPSYKLEQLFPALKKSYSTKISDYFHRESTFSGVDITISEVTTVPFIESQTISRFNSYISVLTIKARGPLPGIYRFISHYPSKVFLAADVLASGTVYDGTFDLVFDATEFIDYDQNLFYVEVESFAKTKLSSKDFPGLDLEQPKLFENPIILFDSFSFLHKSLDKNNVGKKNIVLFSINIIDIPILRIKTNNYFEPAKYESYIGSYSSQLNMYVIEFELPSQSLPGELDYSIFIAGNEFTSAEMQRLFADRAKLTVDTTTYDFMPPMITSFTQFVDSENDPNQVEFGWYFQIKDQLTGFDHGVIHITANHDTEPRIFNITEKDRAWGDQYDGSYKVTFKVPREQCRELLYYISYASLSDKNGITSKNFDPYALNPVTELMNNHAQVHICTTPYPNVQLATLTAFTLSTSNTGMTTASITIRDIGGLGLSTRHHPYIFVQGIVNYIKIETVLSGINNQDYTYQASFQIPYDILLHGYIVSLYGITDQNINVRGYSSKELQALGFTSIFTPTDVQIYPVIDSTSEYYQGLDELTIYGKRLSELCAVWVKLGNEEFTKLTIKFRSATMIKVDFKNPQNLPIQVKVYNTDHVYSNVYDVPFRPFNLFKKSYLYVDPISECDINQPNGCGTFANPFKSIKQAFLSSSDPKTTTIVLLPGNYVGLDNTEITINGGYREIVSLHGPKLTLIDCEGFGFGFQIIDAKRFALSGVTIQNCKSKNGGAFYSSNSVATLTNIRFINNFATDGGAIYVTGERKLTLTNCLFKDNQAISSGASIYASLSKILVRGELTYFVPSKYQPTKSSNLVANLPMDVLCLNSTITIQPEVILDLAVFECLSGCNTNYPKRPICSNKYKTTFYDQCGQETCASLPNQCSCSFSGVAIQNFKPDCEYNNIQNCQIESIQTLQSIHLENYLGGMSNILSKVYGYLSIKKSKYVTFSFTGSNFGFIFKVNGVQRFSMNQSPYFNNTMTSVYLVDAHVHYIEIILFSSISEGNLRSFKAAPFLETDEQLFYSNLICGDRILNEMEKNPTIPSSNGLPEQPNPYYCPPDLDYPAVSDEIKCGNGICDEEPNSCFGDCYEEYTKTCPTRTVPDGHIAPGFVVGSDTLGDLIYNQFIWKLPGSDHLTFGMNILNGEEGRAPLFHFDYCENVASTVIEDIFRENVYQIPKEFNAKILPLCTFSTITSSYGSHSEIASEMESQSSVDFKANVGGSFRGYSAKAAASFSQEKSVEEAKKHSVDTKKKLFKTDLYCTTSFIELDLDRVSLHPKFLESLSQVKTAGDMLELVEIYGTHHYKNSFLGGKLSQITSTLESNVESQGSSSWEETSSASLAASVSSPSFSVSAEVSGTLDKSNSEEEQKSNMEKSSTSRLITYGGAPAAFSPASDGMSSPLYGEWTSTIDLSPVPFNYQLYPIRNLIKDAWTILDNDGNNVKLKDLWEEAETLFYSKNNQDDNSAKYSLIFNLQGYDAKLIVDEPVLEITYYSRENNQIVSHDFKVFVHGTHIDRSGMRETAAFSGNYQDFMATCQDYKAFHLDEPPTYKTTFQSCDGGVKDMITYPIRFDFSGPDFFSSYNKPDISLKLRSGAPLTLKTGSYGKIISWYTNEAILFDQAGVFNSKTHYFATAFLETRWSWHLHNAQNHHYQLNPNLNDGILDDCYECELPCRDNPNAQCPCPQCSDSVIFGFRGAPIPFKPNVGDNRPYPPTVAQQNIHTSAMKKRVAHWGSTLDWFDFSGIVVNSLGDTMMVENEANVGMLTRVNWIKVYWPNSNTPWKRTLKTWHIDDHQVEDLHVSEFLHFEFDQNDSSSLQSKWGFYPLSVNKYDRDLFVYHNYRYPKDGVKAYDIIHPNNLPSYQDVLNNNVKIY